ncbi:urease accessory UreF family protein [Brucella sp. TWI432]
MLHILRLVSPNLPVGGFSYSRGLEWAIHANIIRDEKSCSSWILGVLESSYASLDGAFYWRMANALMISDDTAFRALNDWLAASRESRELEMEDRRMSESLLTVLAQLGVRQAADFLSVERPSYPAAFAIAAHHWTIPAREALRGLMWSVVEAQVMAAIRLIPLGHLAGQRILIAAVPAIDAAVQKSCELTDDEIGNVAPFMAMASAWHETQYSRLFRS